MNVTNKKCMRLLSKTTLGMLLGWIGCNVAVFSVFLVCEPVHAASYLDCEVPRETKGKGCEGRVACRIPPFNCFTLVTPFYCDPEDSFETKYGKWQFPDQVGQCGGQYSEYAWACDWCEKYWCVAGMGYQEMVDDECFLTSCTILGWATNGCVRTSPIV